MPLNAAPYGLSRRALCTGIAGSACLLHCPALARQEPEQETTPDQLFLNLFTRMAIAVRLDQRTTSRFVIDTGAQATSISDRLAEAQGYASGPPLFIHTATSSERVPSAYIPRLRVADVLYENVLAPVFPEASLGAEGLLGINHLRHFRLTMDMRHRRATLGNVSTSGPTIEMPSHVIRARQATRLTPVPTRSENGLLFMIISVNAVTTTAFLDTGAQYSVGNLALLNALGRSAEAATTPVQLHAVSGPPATVHIGPSVRLSLGSRNLNGVPLLYGDLHIMDYLHLHQRPALMVGADIMGLFSQIRIDYHNRKISLGQTLARS